MVLSKWRKILLVLVAAGEILVKERRPDIFKGCVTNMKGRNCKAVPRRGALGSQEGKH